ncbi:MAG: phage capsid protein [Akkermansia sp.]
MTSTISDNYQVKYTNKWGSLLQQQVSRLENYVSVSRDLSGKVVFFDQFGVLDFEEKTTRVGKTILDEAPTLRRSMRPRVFTKAVGYDEFDSKQLGQIDLPVSKTIEGLRAAAGRRMDDVMISAFIGTNYVGEDGMTPAQLPTTQSIAVNYVSSGTATESNLTIAKLRATLQLFEENEAWHNDSESYGDQLVIAASSSQIMSLLRENEVSSYDFNNVKALVEGKIDTFMGFKFIRTQRLPLVAGTRTCLAWVKSKAQFGIWDDFKVKLSVRDDMDEALQIRAKFSCGATRLQEEGFVKILCKESK